VRIYKFICHLLRTIPTNTHGPVLSRALSLIRAPARNCFSQAPPTSVCSRFTSNLAGRSRFICAHSAVPTDLSRAGATRAHRFCYLISARGWKKGNGKRRGIYRAAGYATRCDTYVQQVAYHPPRSVLQRRPVCFTLTLF
jgi:hypothetical protein